MNTPARFALHTFTSLTDAGFDVTAYSRMKFGSDLAARTFATDLADRFFCLHRELLAGRCVIVPAPSTTVPVAATLLSRHVLNRLNARLVADGASPVEWTLAHRNVTYNNNYADLAKAARQQLLAADTIYLNKDFVAGKTLLFVDDCRITGTHEEKLGAYLRHERLPNPHAFLCVAAYAGDDPSVEARLNHAAVRSVDDLVELAREPGHQVTTRALRLLLETPADRLPAVLDRAPQGFVENAFHAAMCKGYHQVHPDAFAVLTRTVAAHFQAANGGGVPFLPVGG